MADCRGCKPLQSHMEAAPSEQDEVLPQCPCVFPHPPSRVKCPLPSLAATACCTLSQVCTGKPTHAPLAISQHHDYNHHHNTITSKTPVVNPLAPRHVKTVTLRQRTHRLFTQGHCLADRGQSIACMNSWVPIMHWACVPCSGAWRMPRLCSKGALS